MEFPYYLTAMDPGGTTGLSMNWVSEKTFAMVEAAVVPYRKDSPGPVDKMKEWVGKYPAAPHVLVYEDFHVRPVRGPVDTTAINVITELKEWLAQDDEIPGLAAVSGLLDGLAQFVRPDGMPVYREIVDKVSAMRGKTGTGPYELIVRQEPVEAKRMVPDEVLKRAGMWVHGTSAQHIRDAQRHAATWLAKERYMPLCRQAWPPRVSEPYC
jgi:hypothetical protein